VLASIVWPAAPENQNTNLVVGISDGMLALMLPTGAQNLRTGKNVDFVYFSADGTQEMGGGLAVQAAGVAQVPMVPSGSIIPDSGDAL
jgi:hypothetical protein